jgi:hypothetical protein
MAETENSLFDIGIDADDYAEAAAEDAPAIDRTHQSEADFLAIKATYSARQDGGNYYAELLRAVPSLASSHGPVEGTKSESCITTGNLLGLWSFVIGFLRIVLLRRGLRRGWRGGGRRRVRGLRVGCKEGVGDLDLLLKAWIPKRTSVLTSNDYRLGYGKLLVFQDVAWTLTFPQPTQPFSVYPLATLARLHLNI